MCSVMYTTVTNHFRNGFTSSDGYHTSSAKMFGSTLNADVFSTCCHCVAMAESSLRLKAHNVNSQGKLVWGVFQTTDVFWPNGVVPCTWREQAQAAANAMINSPTNRWYAFRMRMQEAGRAITGLDQLTALWDRVGPTTAYDQDIFNSGGRWWDDGVNPWFPWQAARQTGQNKCRTACFPARHNTGAGASQVHDGGSTTTTYNGGNQQQQSHRTTPPPSYPSVEYTDARSYTLAHVMPGNDAHVPAMAEASKFSNVYEQTMAYYLRSYGSGWPQYFSTAPTSVLHQFAATPNCGTLAALCAAFDMHCIVDARAVSGVRLPVVAVTRSEQSYATFVRQDNAPRLYDGGQALNAVLFHHHDVGVAATCTRCAIAGGIFNPCTGQLHP
jgi:hypothetical protein